MFPWILIQDLLLAFPKRGEATKHVINHCIRTSASMGRPIEIKTDNGSATPVLPLQTLVRSGPSHTNLAYKIERGKMPRPPSHAKQTQSLLIYFELS